MKMGGYQKLMLEWINGDSLETLLHHDAEQQKQI